MKYIVFATILLALMISVVAATSGIYIYEDFNDMRIDYGTVIGLSLIHI